jgi:hypothetical protein
LVSQYSTGSRLESKWLMLRVLGRIAGKCRCWGQGSLRRPTKTYRLIDRRIYFAPSGGALQIPSSLLWRCSGPESGGRSAGGQHPERRERRMSNMRNIYPLQGTQRQSIHIRLSCLLRITKKDGCGCVASTNKSSRSSNRYRITRALLLDEVGMCDVGLVWETSHQSLIQI